MMSDIKNMNSESRDEFIMIIKNGKRINKDFNKRNYFWIVEFPSTTVVFFLLTLIEISLQAQRDATANRNLCQGNLSSSQCWTFWETGNFRWLTICWQLRMSWRFETWWEALWRTTGSISSWFYHNQPHFWRNWQNFKQFWSKFDSFLKILIKIVFYFEMVCHDQDQF